MPLKFNGEILTPDNYRHVVKANMPKTKSKQVTFVIKNARPFESRSDKGEVQKKMTAEQSILAHDTVKIELKDVGKITGVLQYYKTSRLIPKVGGAVEQMEPYYLHFSQNAMTFDASKDEDLFFFLLVNSKNSDNSEEYGVVPEFELVRPAEVAKVTVADMDLEISALTKLRELKDSNKKQLRAFYESLGKVDWDEHITANDKDWDTVLAPMYSFCKKDPKEALRMMADAGLELASKVVGALNKGIIKLDGNKIIWGDGFRNDITDLKKRTITTVPKGRQHEWQEWLINDFLRSEIQIVEGINDELVRLEA